MGEAKRRDEYREELGKRLERLATDEAAAKAGPVLSPELQRIARMEPVARQAIFNIDLAAGLLSGMASQLILSGRQDLANPFAQLTQALAQLRAQVMQREGSAGIVVAQPGDVPRMGPT